MSGSYEPPVMKLVGNLRDLLAQVCVPHDHGDVSVAGVVLQFFRAGWRISLSPAAMMPGRVNVTVTDDAGKLRSKHFALRSFGEGLRTGADQLVVAGVDFDRLELEQFAAGMDATP